MSQAAKIRRALIEALPTDTSLSGAAPSPGTIFLPVGHVRALRFESNLIIGTRGAGKSFWSGALQDSEIRQILAPKIPEIGKLEVTAGYGEKAAIALYPDSDTFAQLIKHGYQPLTVWRSVALRWAHRILASCPGTQETWEQTTASVESDPEMFAQLMEAANRELAGRKRHGLILFDALDRVSSEWSAADDIIRDLLKFSVYLKAFSNLHTKVFLRDDQFEGRNIKNFPDASKLLATRVDLIWGSIDLHGMLWQHLINNVGEAGVTIRSLLSRAQTKVAIRREPNGIYPLPDELRRNESTQQQVFEKLAGDAMGANRRRGYPYTWVVSHLADSRGRVSPRSFLAAMRSAAEDSEDRHPDHNLPLHYESIKVGVQYASGIRVDELAEVYDWIKTLMKPLEGLTVPCSFSEIRKRWRDPDALPSLKSKWLLPEHLADGPDGVREDLVGLGIFEKMNDGRVNMPDLYRVGFGLGRRGGVKPVPR